MMSVCTWNLFNSSVYLWKQKQCFKVSFVIFLKFIFKNFGKVIIFYTTLMQCTIMQTVTTLVLYNKTAEHFYFIFFRLGLSIKTSAVRGKVCPVWTFFGQGRLLQMRTTALFGQNTSNSSKFRSVRMKIPSQKFKHGPSKIYNWALLGPSLIIYCI